VYRVATNAALDEIRKRERRPKLLADPGDVEQPSTRHAARPERTDPSLADQVADRLDLDAALEQLPIEFRAVVVLRDVIGLDYAEIAGVLDLPPGTVRSRIARGRAALARSLHQPGKADVGNQRPTPHVGRDGPP
jgi:RNA polymerase sigma-70 factor (ECF subfamily)